MSDKFIVGQEAWFYKKVKLLDIGDFNNIQVSGAIYDKNGNVGSATSVITSDGQSGWYWDIGGVRIFRQSLPPTSARTGDIWVDDTDGVEYIYFDDGNTIQWVEFGPTPRAQIVAGIATDSYRLGGNLPNYYLDYNNFTNTPINLSSFNNNVGFITSASASGIATDSYRLGGNLPNYYLDYNNFTNTPINLSSFNNNVGFITSVTSNIYSSRSAAIASTIIANVTRISVLVNEKTYSYIEDLSGTALTTNSGTRTWSPDGDWYFEHFGGETSSPTAPIFVDSAMSAMISAINAQNPDTINFSEGYYFFQQPIRLPRSPKYQGSGNIPMQRFGAASISLYGDNVFGLTHTNFIFCGTGSKQRSIKFVTEGRQVGFHHPVTAGRNFSNSVDAEFTLDDYTNKNSTKANPPIAATSRLFSAAISFEENYERVSFNNIRVITSCQGTGEVQGLSGYLETSQILPYADWDVGIFISNPWGATMKDVAVVGYWKNKAFLSYGNFENLVITGSTPNAEHGHYENCQFQSGVSLRDNDLWCVADKTSANIYLRWTPSHQFDPNGGLVRISTTDTLTGAVYEYGSTSYTSSSTPNTVQDTLGDGWILLRNVRPQGAGADDTSSILTIHTSGSGCSKVNPGFSGGHSHTIFSNCIMTDFAHCSGLDEASPDFNAVGLPGRSKYSCALEISGAPMRAVKFLNTNFSILGPVVIHAGMCRDMTFIGDNYAETRPYKTALGIGLTGTRGGVFLAGSNVDFREESGSGAGAQIAFYGGSFNPGIGLSPFKLATSGTRMSNMTDYFYTSLGIVDLSNIFPQNTTNQLQIFSGNDQEIRIGRREAESLINYIFMRTLSGTNRIDFMDGQISILDVIGIRPNTNDTYTLGQTSFRWSDLFATNIYYGSTGSQRLLSGTGSPESTITAPVGSIYMRTDGGAGTTFYVKESGTGNTGWVSK